MHAVRHLKKRGANLSMQRHPTLPIAKPRPQPFRTAQYNSNKLTVFDGRHRQLDGFLVDRVQRQIYQQPKALE